jgi:two-component system, OmpR family, manganese sensing sensor histidine kinase
MMFQPIRQRLLLSYLLVMGGILAAFAIAVRVVFAHSLNQQLRGKLIALGEGAASGIELKNGQITLESDFPTQSLQSNGQALEWFGRQGQSLGHQGHYYLTVPFGGPDRTQIQAGKPRIQGVTVPVKGSDNGELMGYVRASQSLEEFDAALQQLDLGMIGGIGVALGLSGVGGFWLTRQAMRPIERSFAQLQQFTADASHELRSPLMAIQTNAQVALKYPEGMRPGDAEKFGAIAFATKQMTHLTEDLLFLARTDMQPQPGFAMVNLTELLIDLTTLYEPQAIAKSIDLQLLMTTEYQTMGNATQLRRLFANLLDNALRHTPAPGKIRLSGKVSADQEIEITVQDTGIGIAPDQLSRVFDRFWQADTARSSSSGTCGLGLAIAQAIAQSHGGMITVSSQVGQGSCFTVQLPLVSSD